MRFSTTTSIYLGQGFNRSHLFGFACCSRPSPLLNAMSASSCALHLVCRVGDCPVLPSIKEFCSPLLRAPCLLVSWRLLFVLYQIITSAFGEKYIPYRILSIASENVPVPVIYLSYLLLRTLPSVVCQRQDMSNLFRYPYYLALLGCLETLRFGAFGHFLESAAVFRFSSSAATRPLRGPRVPVDGSFFPLSN